MSATPAAESPVEAEGAGRDDRAPRPRRLKSRRRPPQSPRPRWPSATAPPPTLPPAAAAEARPADTKAPPPRRRKRRSGGAKAVCAPALRLTRSSPRARCRETESSAIRLSLGSASAALGFSSEVGRAPAIDFFESLPKTTGAGGYSPEQLERLQERTRSSHSPSFDWRESAEPAPYLRSSAPRVSPTPLLSDHLGYRRRVAPPPSSTLRLRENVAVSRSGHGHDVYLLRRAENILLRSPGRQERRLVS